MDNKRKIGSNKEELACDYLVNKGYSIISRNYHAGRLGEIDIIANSSTGVMVFFECKYRKQNIYGSSLEAVDYRKQRQICRVALFYINQNRLSLDNPYRFDVIGIDNNNKITHIENAFDFQY